MPVDIKMLIKVLTMLHLKDDINLNLSHEQLLTKVIYKKAITDLLDTLEGIDNGVINTKELINK